MKTAIYDFTGPAYMLIADIMQKTPPLPSSSDRLYPYPVEEKIQAYLNSVVSPINV